MKKTHLFLAVFMAFFTLAACDATTLNETDRTDPPFQKTTQTTPFEASIRGPFSASLQGTASFEATLLDMFFRYSNPLLEQQWIAINLRAEEQRTDTSEVHLLSLSYTDIGGLPVPGTYEVGTGTLQGLTSPFYATYRRLVDEPDTIRVEHATGLVGSLTITDASEQGLTGSFSLSADSMGVSTIHKASEQHESARVALPEPILLEGSFEAEPLANNFPFLDASSFSGNTEGAVETSLEGRALFKPNIKALNRQGFLPSTPPLLNQGEEALVIGLNAQQRAGETHQVILAYPGQEPPAPGTYEARTLLHRPYPTSEQPPFIIGFVEQTVEGVRLYVTHEAGTVRIDDATAETIMGAVAFTADTVLSYTRDEFRALILGKSVEPTERPLGTPLQVTASFEALLAEQW